jgi:rhamnose transport system ATP-binding protein
MLAAAALSKSYGGVRVLSDVDLDVAGGEVHALVGENGAGKSTLIKIVGGAVRPDAGVVRLEGVPLGVGDPRAVRQAGVSIVYQELALAGELSVADNIFLGRERGWPLLNRREMTRIVQERLDALGAAIDARAPVGSLGVAQQQLVEIARALETDARVLIFDEPTASLSGTEVDRLLALVRRLRERGLAILYVSHRFDEIFALADRVTVLRDGRRVATAPIADVSRAQLIRWMVGREISEEFPARAAVPGAPVLEVEGLSHPKRFDGVSFTVRAGEIVGLAGLVGAGRTSVGLALAGAIPASGTVRLGGSPVRFQSPHEALAGGLAYLTEDRKARGIFPEMSTSANLTIGRLGDLARGGVLSPAKERAASERARRDFDVRVQSLAQPAGTLSGGNQQKVLLARFLHTRRVVAVLDEPTRGVDVGARAEIYALVNRLTADGLGVLMISSDLPELLGMADRVIVMREGRVAGELPRAVASAERVMALATGEPSR